jgi:hypothetical protein
MYVEAQMPKFNIIKITTDEGGFSRVSQNSHLASIADLKEMTRLGADFQNWEQVALRRIEEEERSKMQQ